VNEEDFLILDPCIEKTEWIDINRADNPFILPIDKIVFDKLKEKFL
jgi:hypothetical protein